MISVACLLGVFFNPVRTQGIPNIDILLGRIFDDNTTDIMPEPRVDTQVKICGFGKECVPRSLCNANGTVNIYGQDMLNLRIDGGSPCAYLESCCDVGNKVSRYFKHR